MDFLKNSTSNIRTVKTNMSDFRRITWDKKKMESMSIWVLRELVQGMKNKERIDISRWVDPSKKRFIIVLWPIRTKQE